MNTSERNLRGHLAMFTANVIFGLNIPITKAIFSTGLISPYVLSFFRMTGAAVLFWLVSAFMRREKVPAKDLILLFCASLLGIQINQILFFRGLESTSPIDASIIATLVPILTMVFAAIFVKEPITWKKAFGVFMGMSGAIIIVASSSGSSGSSGPSSSMTGNIFCMLSAMSYALYLSLFRGLISRYHPVTLMKWMFLFAAACTIPFFWNDVAAVDYSALPSSMYLSIIYVVGLATFVAYFMIPIGQRNLRPTLVSMYNYIQPFISSIAAVTLGMAVFGWPKALAAVLIFTGVYFVTISKSRAQMQAGAAEGAAAPKPVAKTGATEKPAE